MKIDYEKKVLDPLGFPQVLRIWGEGGCSSKFEEGGLRQYMGEHGGRAALNAVKKYLWMSSFNSKVACKLLKMNFFTHIFQEF